MRCSACCRKRTESASRGSRHEQNNQENEAHAADQGSRVGAAAVRRFRRGAGAHRGGAQLAAFVAVNQELVGLYWQIGEYISRKLESAAWGEGVVDKLAAHIARKHPELRGFTRPNLFRMRQFYETYRDDGKVAPLVRQLPWTHNLVILSRSRRPEEREFYLRMALRERWSKRELGRQLNGALFERVVLAPAKVSPPVRQLHEDATSVFKDTYLVDFLDLPSGHSEADLQQALIDKPAQVPAGARQ